MFQWCQARFTSAVNAAHTSCSLKQVLSVLSSILQILLTSVIQVDVSHRQPGCQACRGGTPHAQTSWLSMRCASHHPSWRRPWCTMGHQTAALPAAQASMPSALLIRYPIATPVLLPLSTCCCLVSCLAVMRCPLDMCSRSQSYGCEP